MIVAVALVNVAFPAIKKLVFVVVALVVDEFNASVLIEEVAFIVPTFIKPALKVEITEVIALKRVANKFVDDALVIVAFVIFAPTIVPLGSANEPDAKIFVTVALVPVAFTQVIFPPDTAIGE
jgi:hypothetical protein